MSFVTDLTFVSVPGVLKDVMGGKTDFIPFTGVFADTAKRIYSVVRKHCCPDSRDPTLLFRRLEYVTMLIGGRDYTARAILEVDGGRYRMLFTGIQHLRDGDPLYAAPIVGVIAGMIEAAGWEARMLSSPKDLAHDEPEAYKVYPARVEAGTVEVVVEPPKTG